VLIVTAGEMKQIEHGALEFGLSFQRLMENAGSAATAFIKRSFKIQERNVVVFCAKGNNGGDGFVVARKLSESGANVVVIQLDAAPVSEEAIAMYEQLRDMGVLIYQLDQVEEKLADWLAQADMVVDAICGTGFKGELRQAHRKACDAINDSAAAIISLDIPTGVCCDSGEVVQGAVKAGYTLVFDCLKYCHILPQSKPFCGSVEVLDIGIPKEARNRVKINFGELRTEDVFEIIPQRQEDSHKGTFGKALIIAGSARYRGAAALCVMGALRCGVGIAQLASTESVCAAAAAHLLEAIFLQLPADDAGRIDGDASLKIILESLKKADAVAFGCGLENTAHTAGLLEQVLKNASCPIVIDADGINALAENIHLLKEATVPVILTPHPGEMARLCGTKAYEIQSNRAGIALDFSRRHGITLLLKGHQTLIVGPDGKATRNQTGNSGLAKGGSGDILTGMIAALLAQGLSPWESAASGAFLHGMAAERTALRRSRTAMLPSELLHDLAEIFAEHGR